MTFLDPAVFANDLEQHFTNLGEARFTTDEFDDVFVMFGALDSQKERRASFENLKVLPKAEVISRARKVARLRSLLLTVKVNSRDLPRPLPTR